MAKNKKAAPEAQGIENIEGALTRAEQYIERNQKILAYTIGGIVLLVAIYLGYQKFYVQPHIEESKEVSYMAEQYFQKDSFELALNGDGVNYGFLDLIDNYGSTPIGNLSNFYAGVCYMKLGQYEEAIPYFEEFDSEDKVLAPMAIGNIGDANFELGNYEEAIAKYIEASELYPNDFVTPTYLYKAAQAYEASGDLKTALETYEKVFKEYFRTWEGRKAEKYIAILKEKLNS
ncbi:MAG: hypothetical protein A2W91_19170 [Bacteroidetes bacterium GWF2_38_335]|nr:MAG: hypothetical protein A2W91_19170 [Bacteroidetes bacterium GWF2_38_335]OFY79882.1 MAG: hypothetical protein A2281_10570 [Bacteroidetes bacterium RIFOXYA12_FULL_38_20]HBS86336.1 hypothetical protein [Bacteroidales bacterium]